MNIFVFSLNLLAVTLSIVSVHWVTPHMLE